MDIPKLPHDHGHETTDFLKTMPDTESFSESSAILRQLSDSSRLRILWLLCHCEDCGVNIAAAFGMTPAAVSHHLKSLKLGGLIKSRRDGKEVYYSLADTETARLVHKMIDDLFEITCVRD